MDLAARIMGMEGKGAVGEFAGALHSLGLDELTVR
jgi:hypothetical protein